MLEHDLALGDGLPLEGYLALHLAELRARAAAGLEAGRGHVPRQQECPAKVSRPASAHGSFPLVHLGNHQSIGASTLPSSRLARFRRVWIAIPSLPNCTWPSANSRFAPPGWID